MRAIVLNFVLLIFTGVNSHSLMPIKTYTYLALGDSYTIGESIAAQENFPNQTTELLRKEGFDFASPEIIAKTGWTTNELESAISQYHLTNKYDLVTLLIGVNNQYRGRSVKEYKKEFEELLKQAIQFAGNDTSHVIVISIPDWGATPFAENRNRNQIAKEIDEYNTANKEIALQNNVEYLDITPWTREAASNPILITADGLHPSGKEYKRWADKIVTFFKNHA
jgi:lysophospholipase L1-like esterase